MAIWAGEEQASFEAVIAGFNELYPNVTVNYRPEETTLRRFSRRRSKAATHLTSQRSASRG